MLLIRQWSLMILMIEVLIVAFMLPPTLDEYEEEESAQSLTCEHKEHLDERMVPLNPSVVLVSIPEIPVAVVKVFINLCKSSVLYFERYSDC